MINLIVDYKDPLTGRLLPNGIPPDQHHLIEQMDGHRLDYPRLFYYLHQCKIPVTTYTGDQAPADSWYLMVLGFFDFEEDYFELIHPVSHKRLQSKEIKLVFTYHEGDNPANIRKRLEYCCGQHGIDPELVWLISGNSAADTVPNCVYWPELEFMYWRTVNLAKGTPFHTGTRSRNYTALCRIDKLWRKVFMSDLWAHNLHQRGYFSYNQYLLGGEDDYFGCALRNGYLVMRQPQVDAFTAAGPFHADELTTDQHNSYAVNMDQFYRDSYVNVVLETMIDIDNSGGVFVSEKTFKPIFNNQIFVEVAAANTLEHLRDLGYKTFGRCIDESYDKITDNQQRFSAVLELTKNLAAMPVAQLHDLYLKLEPEIRHNSEYFCKGLTHRLQAVVDLISCKQ